MSLYKTPKQRYLVFLDVDGVFTSSRVHYAHNSSPKYSMWCRFDPVAVDFMNRIHDRYDGVEFVLMSTWKNFLPIKDDPLVNDSVYHWVEAAFRNSGFRGPLASPFRTNPTDDTDLWAKDRAYEVLDYLDKYGSDVVDYLLFDDNRYRFNEVLPKKRLVQTDHEDGLLYKHMKNAASMMGNWNER